jgi:hypothetical protein
MILAYWRERFPLAFFGPLALILALCAVGGSAELPILGATAVNALSLLAQFRIWDDVADRQADSTTHPHRVLVTAPSHSPVLLLGIALLAINVVIAAQRDAPLLPIVSLAILHAALGCHYMFRNGRTVLGDQLLLSKYPAFVLILAGERLLSSPVAVSLSAAAVYASASAYEAWHDPVSPLAQLLGGRS